jgi:predicted N-acetyltransferase YhbS
METYQKRQENGQNFGLFVDGRLAVVLSLLTLTRTVWSDIIGEKPAIWLSTLATGRDFHGRRLGRGAVMRAVELVKQQGARELYLDCLFGDCGVLPNYYRSLGFEQIARANRNYPLGTFDAVLMRK